MAARNKRFAKQMLTRRRAPVFTPLDQENLSLWLDAKQYTGASSVAIAPDLSGNDNDFKQDIEGEKTAFVASEPNAGGNPAFVWPQTLNTKHLIADIDVPVADLYMVMSYKNGKDSTFDNLIGFVTSDDSTFGQPRIMGQTGVATLHSSSVDLSPEIDGAAPNTVVLPLPLSIVRFTQAQINIRGIGTNFADGTTNPVSNRGWQGPMCEIIAYTNSRTSDENVEILEYLSAKWGITLV